MSATSGKAEGLTEVERLKAARPGGRRVMRSATVIFLPLLAQSASGLAQSKTLRDFPSTELRASISDCASLLALLPGSQEYSCRQTSIAGGDAMNRMYRGAGTGSFRLVFSAAPLTLPEPILRFYVHWNCRRSRHCRVHSTGGKVD